MAHLADFIHSADQLVKYTAEFRKLPEAKHTSSMLMARRLELSELWAEVKSQYARCLRKGKSDDKDFDAKAIEEKYKATNETYLDCLGVMIESEEKLRKETLKPSFSERTDPNSSLSKTKECNSNQNDSRYHGVKLPVCDTETFSGNYLTWPTFRDMFEAIYIQHPHLGEVEKLFHLRSKTTGDAFSIVEKFPLINSSFALAWEALRTTYENTRIIVNNQVKTLLNLPSCRNESAKDIKNLQRHINDCVSALRAHGINVDGWDPILVYACSNHLPPTTLSLWEQSLPDPTALPTWQQMDRFLSSRFQVLETIADVTSPARVTLDNRIKTIKNHPTQKSRVSTFHSKSRNFICKICSGNHSIRKCTQFLALTPSSRFDIVRKHNMCIISKPCYKRLYNPSRLPSSNANQGNSTANSTTSSPIQSTSQAFVPQTTGRTHFVTSHKKVLLATALIKIIGNESTHRVRALIDPGSEVSFVLESVQRRFKLPIVPTNMLISSINSTHAASTNKLCIFSIYNEENPAVPIAAQALVLKQLTSNLPSASFSYTYPPDLKGLRLADPSFNISSQVDLLIGADLYPSIVRHGLQRVCESLVAQNTIFGWIISGPLPKTINTFSTFVTKRNELTLDEQIKRFWELEEVLDRKPILSAEEKFCEELFRKTTLKRADGRYVVRLPFKTDSSLKPLGQSREIALRQFLRTEKILLKDPALRAQYSNVLSEYLQLGHMRKVDNVESRGNGIISSYYLPHHAVLKPESASTKVRVVFNASSASASGVSLNDLLHTGPVLQRDLTSLILRWRFYKYVFNADIEKMYRQIAVHPDHTPYQRILYRFPNSPIVEDFELLTVTFGVNCAPYLALRTVLQLANENHLKYPIASSILQRECYVDDILSGAHDLSTAQRAQRELIELLDSSGFPLRKWTSNSSHLLDNLPPDHILSDNFLKFDKDSTTKTLGVRWNARGDYFYFVAPCFKLSNAPSKREVFSQIAQLFDPAGWLAPIIIQAKIIMQRIWLEATEWDSSIQNDTFSTWQSFVDSLIEIQNIQIPRWVQYSPAANLQFHGFCDSSEKAYAAAVYVRIETQDGSINSHLLCAKSRVAPIKSVSLPRLELCGAVLLSRLMRVQLPNFPVESHRVYLWTDSSVVLAWLAKEPSTWKPFVANRTSEIIDNMGNQCWRHVKSVENPADLATRGLTPNELKFNTLWWHGPHWLRESQERWPVTTPNIPPIEVLERKAISHHVKQSEVNTEDLLGRFSLLSRALRVLTYVFHFLSNASKNKILFPKTAGTLISYRSVSFVRNRLIVLSQNYHFPREYEALSNGRALSPKSSILSLNPYLDQNRLLRVNGRLVNSELSSSEKRPIILSYNSSLAKLFVNFVHNITLHGGNSLMLSVIRRMFWIPKIKNLIKFCIRHCKTCVIYKKKLRQQIMAALPPERCNFSPPFTYTGVDFSGPFQIKSFRGRGCRITKGYACLFVCFSTKAIHLEAASDLTSQVFLAAFARFVARRGLPKKIFSDHGTNFTGASAILRREFDTFLASVSNETRLKYSVEGLDWNFIPPGAPHMGGIWEAGVKSLKTHLRKLGDTSKFTFEEFATILARIEACLNSRPISPMSNDPSDPAALTPGHFLRGSPLLTFPEPDYADGSISLINRWENLKCIQQQLCKRWKEEYLSELHKRFKWQFPEENVKINDLVVVRQENMPSNEWRLGRVIKITTGTEKYELQP